MAPHNGARLVFFLFSGPSWASESYLSVNCQHQHADDGICVYINKTYEWDRKRGGAKRHKKIVYMHKGTAINCL